MEGVGGGGAGLGEEGMKGVVAARREGREWRDEAEVLSQTIQI